MLDMLYVNRVTPPTIEVEKFYPDKRFVNKIHQKRVAWKIHLKFYARSIYKMHAADFCIKMPRGGNFHKL